MATAIDAILPQLEKSALGENKRLTSFQYGSDEDWPALVSLKTKTPGEEEKVKAAKLSQIQPHYQTS